MLMQLTEVDMKLPTVKIDVNGAPVVINESDYDPKVHKLYSDKPKRRTRTTKTKAE